MYAFHSDIRLAISSKKKEGGKKRGISLHSNLHQEKASIKEYIHLCGRRACNKGSMSAISANSESIVLPAVRLLWYLPK